MSAWLLLIETKALETKPKDVRKACGGLPQPECCCAVGTAWTPAFSLQQHVPALSQPSGCRHGCRHAGLPTASLTSSSNACRLSDFTSACRLLCFYCISEWFVIISHRAPDEWCMIMGVIMINVVPFSK